MTPQEAKALFEEDLKDGKCNDNCPECNARELAISALEKQIPKKPDTLTYRPLLNSGWKYQCPNCGCAVGKNKNLEFAYEEHLEAYQSNCMNCGQALDWSDTV